ncbi:MAG: phytanoyl-CoA dioxygenase [Gemmatimonadetes bacterium]|nr:phytanoyl-CoA dioxygenase [Gemmatimonadota bacterium]|tara:strand:- start:4712 stop:5701 length:990 start_codon:yes stop_codon:yes gene_type:complete
MSGLTDEQLSFFDINGYVVVPDVIPHSVLDAVIDEYEGVLDNLIETLYERGDITSRFEGLPFGDRFMKLVIETGAVHNQYFDFSLPFQNVQPDTPFWTGQAVLDAFTCDSLIDVVASVIGPEVYSNPVQHVRIKPPESILPTNQLGKPIMGATQWHQDNGVVVPEADETQMLTVWFSLEDTDIEQGPLKVVPRSHRPGLLTHCPNYKGQGGRMIPETLFEVDQTIPLPVKRGDVILLHRHTVHGSLSNVSDRIRWSFDLRYNPIGQTTGREAFPGFVVRSAERKDEELRDADTWTHLWLETRERMSKINQGGQHDVAFGRWEEGHLDCA